jgi:hypothetical protein
VLCVVAERVRDGVPVDTVVALRTNVLAAVLCVVTELLLDGMAVDAVVELFSDALVAVALRCNRACT